VARALVDVELVERRPGHDPRPDLERTLAKDPLAAAHDQGGLELAETRVATADVARHVAARPAEATLERPAPAILTIRLEAQAIAGGDIGVVRVKVVVDILRGPDRGAEGETLSRLSHGGSCSEQNQDHEESCEHERSP